MKAIKVSIIVMMIVPQVSFSMLRTLKLMSTRKYIRTCSHIHEVKTFDEKLKCRKINFFLVEKIKKRNKKIEEELLIQKEIITDYNAQADKYKYWIEEEYTDKLYWSEKRLQMIAQEKC